MLNNEIEKVKAKKDSIERKKIERQNLYKKQTRGKEPQSSGSSLKSLESTLYLT